MCQPFYFGNKQVYNKKPVKVAMYCATLRRYCATLCNSYFARTDMDDVGYL